MDGNRAPTRVVAAFTLGDLQSVRALVEDMAGAAGLTSEQASDLVLAVSEIAANAIQHAGGSGHLRVVRCGCTVSVVISDNGAGLARAATDPERPDAESLSGRGLWMARALCPDLRIANSPRGLTVTMVASAPLAA
jgi:anti-sigma regulatory factor (Ser/Thr protein kinase)